MEPRKARRGAGEMMMDKKADESFRAPARPTCFPPDSTAKLHYCWLSNPQQ